MIFESPKNLFEYYLGRRYKIAPTNQTDFIGSNVEVTLCRHPIVVT